MKLAITGGTGFIGAHLAGALSKAKQKIVLIARGYDCRNKSVRQLDRLCFIAIGLEDEEKLFDALEGCQVIAHCAGIARESEPGDFYKVHVEGTQNLVNAARRAGVRKIILSSFLKARPDCGSVYHESKYQAEEIVRESGLDYTIIKAGMVYGKGDQMLDQMSHAFHTLPVFPLPGSGQTIVSPLAVDDLIRIMKAAILEDRLSEKTVAVVGPDRITFDELVYRVVRTMNKKVLIFPMPVFFHLGLAWLAEKLMKVPLVTRAQIRMIQEGFEKPYGECDRLDQDLMPSILFTADEIRKALPDAARFSIEDLKYWQG